MSIRVRWEAVPKVVPLPAETPERSGAEATVEPTGAETQAAVMSVGGGDWGGGGGGGDWSGGGGGGDWGGGGDGGGGGDW